jgi:hypothetical protein
MSRSYHVFSNRRRDPQLVVARQPEGNTTRTSRAELQFGRPLFLSEDAELVRGEIQRYALASDVHSKLGQKDQRVP